MDSTTRVTVDLKAVLAENHREFQLLNFYKGVPFITKATLEKVEKGQAEFTAHAPNRAVLLSQKTTTLLSNGLLEPINAQVLDFDLPSGRVVAGGFSFAGSKFANRLELRVEPSKPMDVALNAGGHDLACTMLDISMRGVGLRLPERLVPGDLLPGSVVNVLIMLPDNAISLLGCIRNIAHGSATGSTRISIEFTAAVPEKVFVVRYIMQRRAEILAEVNELYQSMQKEADQ